MQTMRALVKRHSEPGLWLEEVPRPEVGEDDVLIRILKNSICGTDVHIYNWDTWAQKTIPVPMVTGHEFVGRIEAVGRHVHDFHPGEIVSGEGHVVCGRCRNCLAGRRHLCAHTMGVGVNRPGAFAQYLAIPQQNVWHCDPNIPLDVLSCFDPLGNAVHTALSFDVLGEDVLITGAGPIGCMAAAVARHAGARYVIVTDVNPYRLDLATKLGATHAVDVSKDSLWPTCKKRLGMKEGFDVGLEMSGNARAFKDMIANMCHGGKIALLGIGIHGEAGSHQLGHGGFQQPHHQRDLRSRDVRDVVQDDRHDPERTGHFARHHASLSLPAISGRLRADAFGQERQDRARLGGVRPESGISRRFRRFRR